MEQNNSKVFESLLDLIPEEVLVRYIVDNYSDSVKEAMQLEAEP
jgi:hypothetical protein|tara:strand:+ start:270 stop:401 length:132 start_codon:yes stop_codon:yes gene_type:complete